MASRVLVRSVGASASPLTRSFSNTPLKSFVPHSRGHTRLTPPSARPPPSSSFSSSAFARSYSSSTASSSTPKTSTTSAWTKAAVGGTIVLASSAAILSQMTKAPQMESNSSALSPLTGGSVIQDLKDENNRIAVEKKSTLELLRSMMVYKMCTFSLLVDLAPKLIHLAELTHLTAPAYWIVRKTFFAQFCG